MTRLALLSLLAALAVPFQAPPAARPAATDPTSVVPVPRTDAGGAERQAEALRRVRETASANVVFVGASIVQGWEREGASVWQERIAPLGALQIGVGGDRTEHVLWRLAEAPLTRLAPKVIVLNIGSNNLGHGASTAEETVLGIRRVVAVLREQCPQSTVLLHDVFPRGERMNALRGDVAQVNQCLTRLDDGARVRFLRVGDRFVEDDGSIKKETMPDFLHLSPAGYRIWGDAIAPEIERVLAGAKVR
jgi:lysophospholipase L1-like esterase